MLTQDQATEIFLRAEALRKGHFLLASGKHSAEYWEKFWVLQWPRHVQILCTEIARRFADSRIDTVIGPTTGGIILAYEVARQLGVRALYAEKEDGVRMFRRGFQLAPGTRTLIVDDILTSGGSVKECLELATKCGAEIVGSAVLVDRSGGKVDLGCRLESLVQVDIETFEPSECPLCAAGQPLNKPGTTVFG